MQKIKDILETLLSLVLPKEDSVLAIESMTESEIADAIPPSGETESEKCKALFQYKNAIARTAIWEIKYRGNRKITGTFSKLLYEFALGEISDEIAFSDFHNPLLIPIPASRKGIKERGFNQCKLIADEMAKLDGGKNFEVSFDILKKIKETPRQSHLGNKAKRLKNLAGCFKADIGKVHGRNIILIDDVTTTGATMKEAMKTLYEAGAKNVIGFAIAH